jgi:hypothetical protein
MAWRYKGTADSQRLFALTHPLPQAELPAALENGMKLECFHREPRHDNPAYRRAVFCASVQPALFDWFFNASTGYRGAFFDSPEVGTHFNRTLVDHLAPFLADWALTEKLVTDHHWILASLAKPSAKAWLAEHPGICPDCAGEWSSSYVSGLQIENSRWEQSLHVHSAWGRQAPLFSKIRIFGGFMDDQQNEWLAAHKQDRAKHICEHGWS